MTAACRRSRHAPASCTSPIASGRWRGCLRRRRSPKCGRRMSASCSSSRVSAATPTRCRTSCSTTCSPAFPSSCPTSGRRSPASCATPTAESSSIRPIRRRSQARSACWRETRRSAVGWGRTAAVPSSIASTGKRKRAVWSPSTTSSRVRSRALFRPRSGESFHYDMNDFPRILVVTSSTFNLYTGSGISFTNLFRGWPRERLANLHFDPRDPDDSVCGRFRRLSEQEVRWVFPLSLLSTAKKRFSSSRRSPGAAHEAGGADRNGGAHGPPSERTAAASGLRQYGGRIYQKLHAALLTEGLGEQVHLTKDLVGWIDAYRPQLIYTTLGDLTFLRLARLVADHCRVPTVVQIADDWPDSKYRNGLWSSYFRAQMEGELDSALRRASLRFGISDSMCRAYEARYGLSFSTCISPVDVEHWLKHAKRDWRAAGTFRVVYMGTVHHLAQLRSLDEIARTISLLRRDGEDIAFDVYTTDVFVAQLSELFR